MATGIQAAAGSAFTASIPTPPLQPGLLLGARIEVPVTRAIVEAWTPATVGVSNSTVMLSAPATLGDFQVVWQTNDGNPHYYEAFQPLVVVSLADAAGDIGIEWPQVDDAQVRPTIDDVAKLERIRTVDAGGEDVGTFTDTTHPTDEEVDALIDTVMDDVIAALPQPNFDPRHYRQVRRVITLGTAMHIEASYYQEQAPDRAGTVWQTLYTNGLAALTARIESDMAQNNLIGGMEPSAVLA